MGMRHRWLRMLEGEEGYERRLPDRVLMGRMLRYLWAYRGRMLLLLGAVVANTLLSLLPPLLLGRAIDRYIGGLNPQGLALISLALVAVVLAAYASEASQSYLIGWLGGSLEYDLRLDLFERLQRLSLTFHAGREVGGLVSRVMNDVDRISELITSGVANAIADIVTLVGIVAVMLSLDLHLSLTTFTVLPLIAAFMLLWGRRAREAYRRTRRTIASVSAIIEESVSGVREIKAQTREEATRRRFELVNISNLEANVEAARVMAAFWPIVNLFGALGNCLVLLFGGLAVMRGAATIGLLFTFMGYLQRFFWPIRNLSLLWNNIQSALAAAERVFDILDSRMEVEEPPDALELPPIKGRITYDEVTFGYDPEKPVLRGVSLTIEPGEKVAVVGPTGAGKTTLINLLYRFYDPQRGRVVVDDVDVRRVRLRSLRGQMAFVPQEPVLLSGTVLENIRLGRPDASDEEVVEAAKMVGAHRFIEGLPRGYETEVGEGGVRLSLGERQLLSLARATLADPRILILDEALSSVDPYTEAEIRSALRRLLRGRTAIIIAHRLSMAREAARIIVLDEGRVVEEGTHRELMRRGGLYRRLYEKQLGLTAR